MKYCHLLPGDENTSVTMGIQTPTLVTKPPELEFDVLVLRGTCGQGELVYKKSVVTVVMKCIWLERCFKSRIQ